MVRRIFGSLLLLSAGEAFSQDGRWTADRAKAWMKSQGWKAGSNFLPSTASNQFEMFQAENFDEETLDRELGWVSDMGFSVVRVFLHDLLWEQDGPGFLKRLDRFLEIADKHNVGAMLALFDGCWDPLPKLGVQKEPRPDVHNSRWVQAPGAEALSNLTAHSDRLESYVKGVVGHFKDDSRVLLWDVFNEPDNGNTASYGSVDVRVPVAEDAKGTELSPMAKAQGARALLEKAFAWAREVAPSQPLTAGVYDADTGDEAADAYRHETHQMMLDTVDVVSFHNYATPDGMADQVTNKFKPLDRPMVCSEYMSRGSGSLFNPILGYLKDEQVWAINWGFVSGRSQTIFAWDSWQKEYTGDEPPLWFHDILRKDGSPYKEDEMNYIRNVTGAGVQVV